MLVDNDRDQEHVGLILLWTRQRHGECLPAPQKYQTSSTPRIHLRLSERRIDGTPSNLLHPCHSRCHSKDSLSCLGKGGSFLSGGAPLNYVSPVVGISTISSRRCFQCSPLSCPPSSPCRLGGSCGRPACTRRGRCWCRRPRRG